MAREDPEYPQDLDMELGPTYGILGAFERVGSEELRYAATDTVCDRSWCYDKWDYAAEIAASSNRVLTIDTTNNQADTDGACQ